MADHYKQIDKSPYAYTWNNPAKLTDPDGRCPECEKFYNLNEISEGTEYKTSTGANYKYSNGEWTKQGGQLDEVIVIAKGNGARKNDTEGIGNPLAITLRNTREVVKKESNLNDKIVLESFVDISVLKGNDYLAPKVVIDKDGHIRTIGVSVLSGVAGIGQTQSGMYLSTKMALGISSLNVSGSISRDGTIGIRLSSGMSGSPISSGYNLQFTPGVHTGLTAVVILTRGAVIPALMPFAPQLSR